MLSWLPASGNARGSKANHERDGARGKGDAAASLHPASPALPIKAQDPVAAGLASLANAAGALHHLSMTDEGKRRLLAAGGAATLMAIVRNAGVAAPAAWEQALGALWHASLLTGSEGPMNAAGAPVFMCAPAGMKL